MKTYLKVIIWAVTACLFALQSCEEPTDVGRGVIPPNDALFADSIDTFTIVVNTIPDDSIFTSNISGAIIGSYASPTFGETFASLYTEFGLPGTSFIEDPTYIFDSITFHLRTVGYEGDSTIAQSFNIYQMADSISGFRSHYTDTTWATSGQVGNLNMVVPSSDSVFVNGTKTVPHLTTRLDDAYGMAIFQKFNDGTIVNDSSLQANFKGLLVEPITSAAASGTFALDVRNAENSGNFTGMYLHYHNNDDTIAFPLVFSLASANPTVNTPGIQNHNRYWHNYTTAEQSLQDQLASNSSTGFNEAYIQGAGGTIAFLEIPHLKATIPADAQINKAELTVQGIVAPLTTDSILIPPALQIADKFTRSSIGTRNGGFITITGAGELPEPGRLYDAADAATTVLDDNGEIVYTFNMPLYVQNLIAGNVNDSLYLFTPARIGTVNGMKIGGTNSTTDKIQLKIIYSQPQ